MNKSNTAHKSKTPVVVVYGVASFFGKRIAELLCDLGEHVIGIDFPGNQSPLRREGFEYIDVNLLEEPIPPALFEKDIWSIIDVEHSSPHIGHNERSLQKLLVESVALRKLLDLSVHSKAIFIYSSSVDIYYGLASLETLDHYFDGPELSTYFSFLEGKRYGEALCREYAAKFACDVRIARLGEIYGIGMDLHTSTVLTRAIRMSLEDKDLIFDEEGSREYNLIYVDDAAYGLSKLLYSEDPKAPQGIFYFVNTERVSAISIAYVLKQYMKRSTDVQFVPEYKAFKMPESKNVDITRTEKILHWSPQVELTEGLEKVIKFYKDKDTLVEDKVVREIQVEERVEEREVVAPNKAQKGWLGQKLKRVEKEGRKLSILPVRRRYAWLTFTFVLFFMLTPLFLTAGFSIRGVQKLTSSEFASSENLFVQAHSVWRFYRPLFTVVNQSDWFTSSGEVFALGSSVARVGRNVSLAYGAFNGVTGGAIQSLGGDVTAIQLSADDVMEVIKTGGIHLKQAEVEYSLLEKHALSVQNLSLPSFLAGAVDEMINVLWLTESLVDNTKQVEKLFTYFWGVETPRRFVVLLQNNNELRANGGFIGSYLVFTVHNGNISEVKVDDIYNPDGLLEESNTVTAPKPVTQYLGPEKMPLRDTNWWSSFPKGMESFVPLYEKATGETIDGVMALNVSVVQDLLSYIGGVDVATYGETITAQNLSERAQYHAEIGFEAGDMSKRDFLGALFESILLSLSRDKKDTSQAIALVSGKGVLSRNVMLFAKDQDTQKILVDMGVSGEMIETSGDYLRVIDSNVGGNKSNYWVKRESTYDVSVDREGSLSGSLTVTWDHTGTNNTWPNGTYKNYVRVYLPLGVSHVTVSPPLSSQTQYEESARTVIAGLIEVPVSTKQSIRVQYDLPAELSFSQTDTYELVWENQPGLIQEPYKFTLNLPSFLSSKKVSQDGELSMPIHVMTYVEGVGAIR